MKIELGWLNDDGRGCAVSGFAGLMIFSIMADLGAFSWGPEVTTLVLMLILGIASVALLGRATWHVVEEAESDLYGNYSNAKGWIERTDEEEFE